MQTPRGWLVVLGVASGLLLPPAVAPAAQPATPTTSTGIRVVAQQTVDLLGFRLLSMSPDGAWLLGLDDDHDRMCGIAIATMTVAGCTDVRTAAFRGPVEHSVAWSPDGSRVAMTEDALRFFDESDIWVFDVATGHLTNLTDDGMSGGMLWPDEERTPLVDLFPTWAPDGQTIAFARTVGDDWAKGGIFLIDADGGEPEQIAPLPAPGAFAVFPELRWSADGRFLAYSLLLPDRDDPANGVWVVEADGTNQRQVLTDADLVRPLLVELSARGTAFVASAAYLEDPQTHTGPRFAAVELASGAVQSLDALPPPLWGEPLLPMLTFSPDGGRLLFITIAPSRERRLLVYDLDREETQTVLGPIDSWYGGSVPTGMVWGRNDVVFVPGPRGSAILLRLAGTAAP
jgi:Tol biopolymer transport system component